MPPILKLKLKDDDVSRRVPLRKDPASISEVKSLVASLLGLKENYRLLYTDEDSDKIVVDSDIELEEALVFPEGKKPVIRLTVEKLSSEKEGKEKVFRPPYRHFYNHKRLPLHLYEDCPRVQVQRPVLMKEFHPPHPVFTPADFVGEATPVLVDERFQHSVSSEEQGSRRVRFHHPYVVPAPRKVSPPVGKFCDATRILPLKSCLKNSPSPMQETVEDHALVTESPPMSEVAEGSLLEHFRAGLVKELEEPAHVKQPDSVVESSAAEESIEEPSLAVKEAVCVDEFVVASSVEESPCVGERVEESPIRTQEESVDERQRVLGTLLGMGFEARVVDLLLDVVGNDVDAALRHLIGE